LQLPERPPVVTATDPLADEQDYHERFMESRLRVYVGREQINDALLAFADGNELVPCLVTGPSGSGKSAALARFVRDYQHKQPQTLVIPHFIGASPRSTNLRDMLRRFCQVFKARFGFAEDVPEEAAKLSVTFQEFVGKVPTETRVLLVIDALNQLDEANRAQELYWLPAGLPPQVKVIVSCINDSGKTEPLLEAFRWRKHCPVQLPTLSDAEQREIIRQVPSLSAKTLDDDQVRLLLSNPATANPLFLLVALEELRGFAPYERLNERIATFPREGDTVTAIFTQVIERLAGEFNEKLVETVLTLLASARHGLSERELQELVAGLDGADDLFPVLRQLRPYLFSRAGLIDFYHRNLFKAVRERYLSSEEQQRPAHVRLADYFQSCRGHDAIPRVLDEVPFQLAAAKSWQGLYALLSNLNFLMNAWRFSQYDVKTYWTQIACNSSFRLLDACAPVLNAPGENAGYAKVVAQLLFDMGYPEEALNIQRGLTQHYRRIADSSNLVESLGNHAATLIARGDLDAAMTLLQEQEQMCHASGDKEKLSSCLGTQSVILGTRGDLVGGLKLLQEQARLCRESGDNQGLQSALGNLAHVCAAQGDLNGAVSLLLEQERMCRGLGNQDWLQECLVTQAGLLVLRGDSNRQGELLDEAERICRGLGNKQSLAKTLLARVSLQLSRGDREGALSLVEELVPICRELGHKEFLSSGLAHWGSILKARGEFGKAHTLLREAEHLYRELGNKLGLITILGDQASISKARGDLEGVKRLYVERVRLCRELGVNTVWGPLQHALGEWGYILLAEGDLDGALPLLLEQERLCRELGQKDGLQGSLGNQAYYHSKRGNPKRALELLQDQERICRESGDETNLGRCLYGQAHLLFHHFYDPRSPLAKCREAVQLLQNPENAKERGDAEALLRRIQNSGSALVKWGITCFVVVLLFGCGLGLGMWNPWLWLIGAPLILLSLLVAIAAVFASTKG